jgi:O-6-methylguanine DNA methyltransferase
MSGGGTDLQTAVLETTWGCIAIAANDRGVVACHLPEAPAKPEPFRVLRVRLPRGAKPVLKRAAAFARALVEGRVPGACPALDPSVFANVPEFHCAIWTAMQKIPRGSTMAYSELARRVGCPRAARAVGSACGANPLPLFVPCHRVVAADGRLGGFSSGPAWKKLLLSGEGAMR